MLIKKVRSGGKQMDKMKLLMSFGAVIIILFIGWFYIDQLQLPETVFKEDTIAEQVENTRSKSNVQDDEMLTSFQRTDSQGTVVIQATLLPEKKSSNQIIFEIKMNTHSGDLLQYNLEKIAQISFGSNLNTTGTFKWDLANEDSHHLVGYLTWSGEVVDDRITLTLNNIENVSSRTFIWEKNNMTAITATEN